MKKLNSLLIALLIILSSCTKDDMIIEQFSKDSITNYEIQEAKTMAVSVETLRTYTPELKAHRAASIALAKYVLLNKEAKTYSLNITKEEAQKLGISPEMYDKVMNDLNDTNKAIQKALKAGQELTLPDIQEEYKEYEKQVNYPAPLSAAASVNPEILKKKEGEIKTSDGVMGWDEYYPAFAGVKNDVLFSCTSRVALLPLYNVALDHLGMTVVRSGFASAFRPTELIISISELKGLAVTAPVKLGFQTSDSNGGWCVWKGR